MHCKIKKSASFIALFCFLIGTGILHAGAFQSYNQREEFHQTLPLGKDGVFILTNVNGPVSISTWGRDEVDILAEKAVRGNRGNLEKIKIEIESGSNRIAVSTIFPRIRSFRGKVSYEIKVPEGLKLENIKSVNGNLHIAGPVADVRARTTNGNITVADASGQLVFSTTNGNVVTENLRGEIDARTTNGSVKLAVDSISGSITSRSTNGSITLEIDSPQIDADIQARTTNGRVTVDFPVTIEGGQISKRRLNGRIGGGGPLISLSTTNGQVKILK